MKNVSLLVLTALFLSGCGSTKSSEPEAAHTEGMNVASSSSSTPMPLPSDRPAPSLRIWKSADGMVSLRYPADLTISREFAGTYFTPAGWRAMFDGSDPGPGKGLVRFSADASLDGGVPRMATDTLQIGMSEDPSVVEDCLTRGIAGGNSMKQPDRMIGGVPFTVYRNGDAGMSHQLSSMDMRAVYKGRCIAIDRLTVSIPASVGTGPLPKRTALDVGHDFDAILSSMTFR